MPPSADTTTITRSFAAASSTMFLRFNMLFTEPTDVPPNFITFITVSTLCSLWFYCNKVQMYCFYIKTATFFRATWVWSALILFFHTVAVVKCCQLTGKRQKNSIFAIIWEDCPCWLRSTRGNFVLRPSVQSLINDTRFLNKQDTIYGKNRKTQL